jgi:serine/threonine protein kinase
VTSWWISIDGTGAFGPIATAEMERRCLDRIVQPKTCVWREGLHCWIPIEHVSPFSRHCSANGDRSWYVRARGVENGPMTLAEVWDRLARGVIATTSAVSYERACWVALADNSDQAVAGLRATPMLDELLRMAVIVQRGVPRTVERRVGKYELLSLIGVGGMGEVYAASCEIGGRTRLVALKRILDGLAAGTEKSESFLAEARILIGLAHPNIVSVIDVGIEDDRHYIAMELAAGSVQSAIRDQSLYERGLDGVLDTAIDAAEGLHFVHTRGHVHQDVKSANLLIGPQRQTMVSDFGLCNTRRMLDTARPALDAAVTARGLTLAYASPEQLAAMRDPSIKLTPASDLWSWAVTVLEMFVGGVSWQAGLAAPLVLDDLPDGPVAMPAAVEELLRACFQRDPARRPASLRSAVQSLRDVRARDVERATRAQLTAVAGDLSAPRVAPNPSLAPSVPRVLAAPAVPKPVDVESPVEDVWEFEALLPGPVDE